MWIETTNDQLLNTDFITKIYMQDFSDCGDSRFFIFAEIGEERYVLTRTNKKELQDHDWLLIKKIVRNQSILSLRIC